MRLRLANTGGTAHGISTPRANSRRVITPPFGSTTPCSPGACWQATTGNCCGPNTTIFRAPHPGTRSGNSRPINPGGAMPFRPAARVAAFGTSIFTDITQLAVKHQAIDLSTGYPDADGPAEAKAAVAAALREGKNQYALSHGEPLLRQAVADHEHRFFGKAPDPEPEVTITNGAAEALHSVMDGLITPGEEVILLEPYYEAYTPNVIMAGGVPRDVPLRPPQWQFDPGELAAAFNNRTRAILVNTPHNPTGKVFSREELETIAALCQRWNVIAITDEVYEHLVYEGAAHVRLAQLPGMAERTVVISSLSKTFSFTGWKVGWAI